MDSVALVIIFIIMTMIIMTIIRFMMVLISMVVWVAVTFLVPPAGAASLKKFYERVRPGGPGWRPVEQISSVKPARGGGRDLLGAVSGAVFVYTSLFALGKLLLGFPPSAWIPFLLAAVGSGASMLICLKD